jgi:hypothetical protein
MLMTVPLAPSVAQDQGGMPGVGVPPDQNAADPPARVGRVARAEGPVSFHAADDGDWQPAALNWPVVQGNSFWTEPGARAVLELGGARVGLAGGTEVDVQQLDYQTVLLNVPQGSVFLRVRDLDPDQRVFVATPSGTVQLLAGGSYHVDAGDNGGPGGIAVYEGEAAVLGDAQPVMFEAGEAGAIVPANAPPPVAAAPQAIDSWADIQPPPPAVATYIPPDMPGAVDLAYVGAWERTEYGPVWFPPVGRDWAPYRYGHWAFVQPWGWTWVDDAPWGFAPFHYGRWSQIAGRWGWIPGQVAAQPVYAPALVTFIGGAGWNPGVAISVGGGGVGVAIGWIPLGPQEVYRPWYHTSDRYFRQVNVTNVTNITNITINNYAPPAPDRFRNFQHVTVVNAAAMSSSAPIDRAVVKVPPQALTQAPVARGGVPVKPSTATIGANPNVVRREGGDLNAHPGFRPAPGPMQGGKPRMAPPPNVSAVKPLPPGPHAPAVGGARRPGFGQRPGPTPATTGTPGPGPDFKKPAAPGGPPNPAGGGEKPGPEFKRPIPPGPPNPPNPPNPPAAAPGGPPKPGPTVQPTPPHGEFKRPAAPTVQPPPPQAPQPPNRPATPPPEFKKPTPPAPPTPPKPPAPPSNAPGAHPAGGNPPPPGGPPGVGHPPGKEPPPKCDPKTQKCP